MWTSGATHAAAPSVVANASHTCFIVAGTTTPCWRTWVPSAATYEVSRTTLAGDCARAGEATRLVASASAGVNLFRFTLLLRCAPCRGLLLQAREIGVQLLDRRVVS